MLRGRRRAVRAKELKILEMSFLVFIIHGILGSVSLGKFSQGFGFL